MKVYQQKWIDRLIKTKSQLTLYRICVEIIKDDTGHTDMLAQVLAKSIISVIYKR